MNRRGLLTGLASLGALAACGRAEAQTRYAVRMSDADWRRKLGDAAWRVLRHEATEPAFTSPLDREKRAGTFLCKGCAQPLYASRTKFDSGTGWPSFWQPINGAIGTKTDFAIGMPRTEVHCSRCGGHLGHVFNDGPPPTGKRYCMNGLAMTFRPAA